jgi:AraC family transcriptional regulator of adaptative response/methylated-DNA-[protein]-cysteine methyltransferase
VGFSRFHFQRVFKAQVGLTPRQYAEACRVGRLKDGLRDRSSVTDAIYDAGFGSGSRVYERVDTHLGMTPRQYRDGGRGVSITYACARTPLGLLLVGATDRGLCFVQFGERVKELVEALRREYPEASVEPMRGDPRGEFAAWMRALEGCVRGLAPREALPLDLRATAFQATVWRYLQTIPAGETRSYAQVAEGVGRPAAARAVARACAANRVALAIPCHRVIRGTGEAGGYRWGAARKRALLDAERAGVEA